MKIKIIVMIFLILYSLLSGCNNNNNEFTIKATTDIKKIDLSIFTKFNNISYDKNIFYMAKGGNIYIYDSNFKQVNKIILDEIVISTMCVADKNIYACNMTGKAIYAYNSSGELYREYNLENELGDGLIRDILYVNNKLIMRVAYTHENIGNENLFIYDINKGEISKYFIDSIDDMSEYKNDYILIRSTDLYMNETKIFEFSLNDYHKNELLKLNMLMSGKFIYDSNLDSIYFSDGANIRRTNLNDGKQYDVFKSNYQIITNIFIGEEYCYAFDEKTMNVYMINKRNLTKYVNSVSSNVVKPVQGNDETNMVKGFKKYKLNIPLNRVIEPQIDIAGRFYLMDIGKMYVFNNNFETEKIIDDLNGKSYLCISGNIFYYDYEENGIIEIDNKGALINTYNINFKVDNVRNIIPLDDYLVLISIVENNTGVILFNMKTHETSFKEINRPADIFRYKNNLVLKLARNKENDIDAIEVYDLITGKVVEVFESSINAGISNLTYDMDTDAIYYAVKGNVYRLALNNGGNDILFRSDIQEIASIIVDDIYCYMFARNDGSVYRMEKDEYIEYSENAVYAERVSDKFGTLKICLIDAKYNNNEYYKKISEIMTVKFPNVEIIYEVIGNTNQDKEEYKSRIITELMAKSSSFDIFTYNSNIFHADILASDGVYGIENNYEIKNTVNMLFDGVKSTIMRGNKITGAPITVNGGFVSNSAWEVNKNMFEQNGIQIPEPEWTYMDFYRLAVEMKKDVNGDGIPDNFILSTPDENTYDPAFLLRRYFNNIINGKYTDITQQQINDELCDLAETVKRMKQENLFYMSTKKSNNVAFWPGLYVQPFISGEVFIPQPSLKTNNSFIIYPVELLCVNSYSKYLDVALEYIASYMSKDLHFSLVNYVNPLYNNREIYINNNRTSLGERTIMSVEDFNKYALIMNNLNLWTFNMDFAQYQKEIEIKFINDEIPLADYVDLITKKIDMITKE